MIEKRIRMSLLFFAVVLFNVLLTNHITEKVLQINCFSYETAYQNFRDHRIAEDTADLFLKEAGGDTEEFSRLLAMYFASDCTETDTAVLKSGIGYASRYRSEEFARLCQYIYAVWNDLERFPVGAVDAEPDADISFADSWMQSRTFGGERGHEGTDLMATVNRRGLYPVYSMTDGVVEQIGWLKLGGWRIGIRSDSGAYFYYAHMAEYAKEFQIGERVEAGTFLGFMGDTGYSEIPGTTGKFDVHLHVGIYLNDQNGREFSVNSYPMLRYLWKKNGERLV
ncbi:MAG: M23 family metallopeptidase [Roseburia sp.]|jgi:murein DD-endopeptidase MepM/ murein hydrolase activator NlpD|nr:M23 family metallopeptidase [Roseburia sp.]